MKRDKNAVIVESPTYLKKKSVPMNTNNGRVIRKGLINKILPSPVAAPLPPLKLNQTG